MKLTNIRVLTIDDKDNLVKPTQEHLELLCDRIVWTMKGLGFITTANVVNSQSIKIGINQRQFQINTTKLGYNTQHRPGHKRRTNLPSWDQRVTFNDTLNTILDVGGYSANVKSGPFTIRRGVECLTEQHWNNQIPEYLNENNAKGYYVEQGDYKNNFVNQAEPMKASGK